MGRGTGQGTLRPPDARGLGRTIGSRAGWLDRRLGPAFAQTIQNAQAMSGSQGSRRGVYCL